MSLIQANEKEGHKIDEPQCVLQPRGHQLEFTSERCSVRKDNEQFQKQVGRPLEGRKVRKSLRLDSDKHESTLTGLGLFCLK